MPLWRLIARLVPLVSWCACVAAAHAQESDGAWQVRAWKSSEGLAGNNVTGLAETDDGFLWILAGNQLERFDGVTLRHCPLESFAGPPARKIREFVRTRDGGFAFGTFEGELLRTRGDRVETLASDLPHLNVRLEALCEESAGSFLVTYNDESVWRVRGGKSTLLTEDDGLPRGAHCRFVADRAGQAWFAKGDCVGVSRGDRFETLQRFPENTIARVAPARDGGVWVAAGARLLRLDLTRAPREIATLPLKNISVRPNALLEDRSGAVWFGSYASGLFRSDGQRWETVPISHRQVTCLAEDREGSVWVGTSGGGVNQVQPRAITIEGGETGVVYEGVQALAEDAGGKLWGLTHAGQIVVRQHRAWENVAELAARADVSCLAAEPGGALWFGTKNGTLHRWSDGQLATWSAADGIAASGPRLLLVARNGDVWLASPRPRLLQRMRAGKLQSFDLPGQGLIRALAEDATGNLWIAGNGPLLARITPDDLLVDESARIADARKNIRQLATAPDGTLWIGFNQGGVGRLKNGAFGRVTTAEGLLADNIECLLRDDRGWLWLVGGETLSQVSEHDLAAVAEGRARRVQPVRHGQEQGIRPNFGETIGALRRRDGKLWIPMATSLAIIDPAQQRARSDPPPVWITEVRVDEKTLARLGSVLPVREAAPVTNAMLALAPDHRRLDFDFTALSFRTPTNVHFRYRLEHFDDGWIDAGPRRGASYSRLAAGDYTFRVRACNSEGVWNDAGAALAFTVAPFFWDTWWFRGALVAVFTVAVFSVARYVSHRRLHEKLRAAEQEAAVERERARIARDIHDDLGSRLTRIVLLSGLAARQRDTPEAGEAHVQEIGENARQLIRSLDETVWAVNPRNDTLPHLVSYLGQWTVTFLRTAEIACELDLPVDPPAQPIAADVRHHVFLALKEALSNVVRHAHATRVTLAIATSENALEITLTDNGRGFARAPDDPNADGLRNLQQRMTQIGGRCEIASAPGAGTRVVFTLPLARGGAA